MLTKIEGDYGRLQETAVDWRDTDSRLAEDYGRRYITFNVITTLLTLLS